MIQGSLDVQRAAIDLYHQIIKAAEGIDPVTQDLAVKLLSDEEAHHSLFSGFLKSLDGKE